MQLANLGNKAKNTRHEKKVVGFDCLRIWPQSRWCPFSLNTFLNTYNTNNHTQFPHSLLFTINFDTKKLTQKVSKFEGFFTMGTYEHRKKCSSMRMAKSGWVTKRNARRRCRPPTDTLLRRPMKHDCAVRCLPSLESGSSEHRTTTPFV